jgi:hypothetical protein
MTVPAQDFTFNEGIKKTDKKTEEDSAQSHHHPVIEENDDRSDNSFDQ